MILFLLLMPLTVSAQPLEENNWVVELGVGFPTFKPISTTDFSFDHGGSSTYSNTQDRKYGQFVLKTEYLFSDKIGVIAGINYSQFYSHNEYSIQEYNGATQQYESNYYYTDSRIHRWRFGFGINFHLLRTSRVDSYFGVMAGSKRASINFSTNDPYYTTKPSVFVFPFAMRLQYGLRVFFTDYLGANLEMGLGGPLVSFGLTYKIL